MKVFIFNREKYIKERLDVHKEYSEKINKLTDEEKERMIKITTWVNLKSYFEWANKPSEEFEKELKGVKWAKELDGVIIDNWVSPFGNHLEYYNRDIDEKWCDVVEDEGYVLDYRKVTNICVIHELLKEVSNNKEIVNVKELMNTLSKFGKVTKNEEYNRIDLIFGDKSSDDIWIKEIDDENCYIVAYGGCDSRCMGGWIFDYRDEYKEEDNE